MPPLRSFAFVDRFLAELGTPQMRPGYILLGDETFLYERCRRGVLQQFVPPEMRDFCLHDLELSGETNIFEVLDIAQTPSLMAPFQVLFVRGLKALYGRGAKKDEFAAIDAYFRSPNPQALLLFVADHLSLPTDLRRMERDDKDRYDRIRETLGEWCGTVELQRVDEADAAQWVMATAKERGIACEAEAARELVDALGGEMMLIASELEKLMLYVSEPVRVPQGAREQEAGNREQGTGSREQGTGNKKQEVGGREQERWGAGQAAENGQKSSRGGQEELCPVIALRDVETMVLAAKQRSLYELTDAISLRDRPQALALLQGLLNASDGGEDSAIGHLYMLARTFRQMLIIHERNVRDSRAIWGVLWQGFRMPPFAAEELIRQARRYRSSGDLSRALKLIAHADLQIRSSPVDKSLVLERLVLGLASEPKVYAAMEDSQFA